MAIFDTHAHYMRSDYGDELDSLLERMPGLGVERVLAIGCDIPSSIEEIELADRYDYIYSTAGIHPEHAAEVPDGWDSALTELLKRDKVVALGEIGLDYHYPDGAPKEVQKAVFIRQLEIAERLSMPVVIHSRDASGDTLEILKRCKPAGVVHCFSGSAETAREIVKLGMYVGFTGFSRLRTPKRLWRRARLFRLNGCCWKPIVRIWRLFHTGVNAATAR